MKRSRWLLPLLVVCALVGGAFYFDSQAAKGDRELDVYVRGGQRMAVGEEIYRRGVDDKAFTYPPFAALVFVPFSWLPTSWHAALWFGINFLLLVAMLRWLHRFAGGSNGERSPPRLLAFWLPTAVYGGHHVVSVFTNQSNDLLIAGAVAATAAGWCRGRWSAGIWVGFGAALKATPLLFVGMFGQRRSWRALAAMLAAVLVGTFACDVLFPRVDGRLWVQAWYEILLQPLQVGGTADTPGAWGKHSVLNQSLSGVVHRLFQPVDAPDHHFVVGERGDVLLFELSAGATKAVTLAAFGSVLAGLWLAGRFAARAMRSAGDGTAEIVRRVGLGEVAVFACGMVLLSPQSSKAHFCVWLFPVAFVVDALLRRRSDVVLWALFVPAFVLGMLSKGLVGRSNGTLLLAYGNVTWSTVLLMLASLRALWAAARER